MSKRRGQGEGSVSTKKRADGRYQAHITLPDGKRRYYYGRTRAEALDKLQAAISDQRRGLLPSGPNQTVAEYLDAWLENVVKPSVRPKTLENYARIVRVHLSPGLGKVRLTRLTAQALQAYYADRLRTGASPSSVGRHHAILHRALAQAVRWELVTRNICDLVDPPRIPRKEMRALTREEAGRLLEASSGGGGRYHALFVLALTCGLRQSELLGLKWGDVDFQMGTLGVSRQLVWIKGEGYSFSEPKSGASRRTVSLPRLAVEALREHRERQEAERRLVGEEWTNLELVFPNGWGKPTERGNLVRRSFHPLLEKAVLSRVRFHDLRHTHATLLLAAGANPRTVQERLGHSDVSLTLGTYGHVTGGMAREAADTMDRLLGD